MNNLIRFQIVLFCIFSFISYLNAQWVPTNGPEGGYILSFASSGSNIYAGTDGGGVYIFSNGGSSWASENKGLDNLVVRALFVKGDSLYAGTGSSAFDGGIYLSVDNGSNWSAVNNGLLAASVSCFAEFGAKLLVGTVGHGIYVSSDNGLNWYPDTAGLSNMYILSLLVKDTIIFAGTNTGVCLSTINDTVWTRAAPADMHYISVQSIVMQDSNLFVAGSGAGVDGWGIFRSSNNGSSWIQVNSGLDSYDITALTVLDSEIFAGASDGITYSSKNNGLRWDKVDTLSASVYTLSTIDGNLFTGTYGGGAYLSVDNGVSWNVINNGLKNSKINAVAVKDSVIFAGTMAVGIYRSTDNGNNWSQVNEGLTSLDVVGLAVSDSNLFAGVAGGGVFKSTNNGDNWSKVGSQVTGLWNTFALAAIDTNLFAGTLGSGVYRSGDNGTIWTLVNNGLTFTGISALTVSDSNLFAGTYGGGVFLTTDLGENWVSRGLKDYFIIALAASGTYIFANTLKANTNTIEYYIFVSTNNGETWTKVDSSAGNESILSLAANSSNLYAGSGMGIVYQPVSKITTVKNTENAIPATFNLYQNYPNPFNPTTTITYSLPKNNFVTLKIYDLLGREVTTLVNEEKHSGTYKITWNAQNIPSGVYFYRLTASEFSKVNKMILLK
jgi:hypothetical protein